MLNHPASCIEQQTKICCGFLGCSVAKNIHTKKLKIENKEVLVKSMWFFKSEENKPFCIDNNVASLFNELLNRLTIVGGPHAHHVLTSFSSGLLHDSPTLIQTPIQNIYRQAHKQKASTQASERASARGKRRPSALPIPFLSTTLAGFRTHHKRTREQVSEPQVRTHRDSFARR